MKNWIVFIFICFLLTAGWWVAPSRLESVSLCLFKYLIHLDCPGCGLTRSFLSLARGEVVASFRYNAAGPLIYLLFLSYAFDILYQEIKGAEGFRWPLWLAKGYSFLVVLFLFGHWILRLYKQVSIFPSFFY